MKGEIMKSKYSLLCILGVVLSVSAFAEERLDGSDPTMLFSPSGPSTSDQVCLTIDTQGTENSGFRNQAWNVKDPADFFYVNHGKESCFDLSKSYYMSYFLYRTSNTIVYGTICRYNPKAEDSGKVLRFIGNNGNSICPIEASEQDPIGELR
jgi:hypothetical protein